MFKVGVTFPNTGVEIVVVTPGTDSAAA